MPTYYMAVDIGASSGRNIIGWFDEGKIHLKEIHRFANGPVDKNGVLTWEVDRLFAEIVAGMKKAGEMGMRPESVGVDTWGVDFVLLDSQDAMLGPAVSYRDSRTQGMDAKVFETIKEVDLYARTGIQTWIFNTIYQLAALRAKQPELLDRAASFLMMPDYLHFLLTGRKTNEYTNASTSQMLDAVTGEWDQGILSALGFPAGMFNAPQAPGSLVGSLRAEIRDRVGYDAQVVLPPTHDTAAAVLAVPAVGDDGIYLSSGTWSLMGIEIMRPDCREACLRGGFTNEGGYGRRYTFLKNIMGLWIIQSLRKEILPERGFGEVIAMAKEGMGFETVFDVNAPDFLAPASMKQAIIDWCAKNAGCKPANDEQLVACAYRSLANSYADTVREIGRLTGRNFDRINIVGGGCQDDFLNRLTAQSTGKTVYAGPVEATAIGNILCQMLRQGVFKDIAAARRAVADSFEVKKVEA